MLVNLKCRRLFVCLASLSVVGIALGGAEPKPVVAIAHRYDAKELVADVMNACDMVGGRDSWMSPLKYEKHSVVYLGGTVKGLPPNDGWAAPELFAAVKKFVTEGGTLILGKFAPAFLLKGQPAAGEIFGFAGMARFTDVGGVKVPGDEKTYAWCTETDVLVPEKMSPDVQVLATFVSAKHKDTAPAATRHKVGKGQVYWVQMPYFELKASFEKKNLPLTEDGANGEHILTVEGQLVDSLAKFYQRLFKSGNGVQYELKEKGWALKPLGEPGTLQIDDTFRNKPVFLPRKTYKDAFVLVGNGVKAVVVAPEDDKGLASLADELAWHLTQISGETVPVVDKVPEKGPAIVLGGKEAAADFGIDFAKLRHEESVIRIRGERVYVGGEGWSGASHAVTYLLEALGCRYLWPGKTGKVVPRRNPLTMPDIDAAFVPKMHARGIRYTGEMKASELKDSRTESGLRRFGIDLETYCRVFNAARLDRPGNRDFFLWHGVSDNEDAKLAVTDSKCPWKIGHFYRDFWPRYSKEHPEWFGLQMSGTRFQNLGRRQNRPTLCLSNEELAKETAKRIAEQFDVYPWKEAWTVGLPDGGPMQECMCPKCRALDPVNAPMEEWSFLNPKTAAYEHYSYVAITDRVLTFFNRVAAQLAKIRPGKSLTFYAYNCYTTPPVKVRPDPSLICLSVSGNYTDINGRAGARRNIARWQRLCPRTLWRPNALWGFHQVAVPQDFSRAIGGDVEWMKANGLLGTDFDCMGNEWAKKGLTYYIVSRTLFNPDRLSPDDLIDDYCTAGFGKAAPAMRDYFRALENVMDTAATAVSADKATLGTDDQERRLFYANRILAAFDPAKLGAILDRAERLAADDPDVLARIRFQRVGYDHGCFEKKLGALRTTDQSAYEKVRADYVAFIVRQARENPLAVPPAGMARQNPFLNSYNPKTEK